jgi:hypothetical protein
MYDVFPSTPLPWILTPLQCNRSWSMPPSSPNSFVNLGLMTEYRLSPNFLVTASSCLRIFITLFPNGAATSASAAERRLAAFSSVRWTLGYIPLYLLNTSLNKTFSWSLSLELVALSERKVLSLGHGRRQKGRSSVTLQVKPLKTYKGNCIRSFSNQCV